MRTHNQILSAALILIAAGTIGTNANAGSAKSHLLLPSASGYSKGGDFGTVIGPKANFARRSDLVSLNPQPLPPGGEVSLNPQPLPPGGEVSLNPHPLPPKIRRLILN
jgi:hypothetical protein